MYWEQAYSILKIAHWPPIMLNKISLMLLPVTRGLANVSGCTWPTLAPTWWRHCVLQPFASFLVKLANLYCHAVGEYLTTWQHKCLFLMARNWSTMLK